MRYRGWVSAAIMTTLGLGAGLQAPTPARADEAPLNIVATVGMIADVARQVGGTCLEVEAMMGPGIDPHLYQPSAGDVRDLVRADAILYAGLFLEGQLGEVLDRLRGRKPTVAVAELAVPQADRILTGEGYGVDPHVWMDVGLWARTAPVIAEALAPLAPLCAEQMRVRATAYATMLEALDGWIVESMASLPEPARVLVTAHDAFAYYGRAYAVEVIGIQGVSTEAEAGIADIRDVVATVIERRVPAIFVESTINPRTVEAVIEAARRAGHDLALGHELFSDAMGAEGTAEGTYIGMLHANTAAIVSALGGRLAPLPASLAPWAEAWDVAPGG